MSKKQTDLHTKKASHLTVPVVKGLEVHLDRKDFGKMKHKTGQKVDMKVPMVTTSVDKGHVRFVQRGRLKPELPAKQLNRAVKKVMKGAK